MSNTTIGKIVILLLLFLLIFLLLNINERYGKVYDCEMARWHPDIPKEVRDECRRLFIDEQKRRQELEQPKTYRT